MSIVNVKYKIMKFRNLFFCISILFVSTVVSFAQEGLWNIEKAKKWEKEHPWYCGVNYIPSNAINYTAMWDKTSFSPELIDKEMQLMEELGMNCVRVVLQYVVYEDDPDYFIQTFDHFLNICNTHGIKVMPVFLMIVYLV